MSDFNYEFRILIESEQGTQYAYGTSSLVSLPVNTSKVVTTEQMVDSINMMPSMSYYNAPGFSTSSGIFNENFPRTNPPPDVHAIFGNKYYHSQSFGETQFPTFGQDYQFLSCSIKDHNLSGSIIFHTNTEPETNSGYILKRYKFWGNKVCQVLGVPENYWIYSDKFRLSNTGSEANYLTGDVLATSLNLKTNFAINNAGSITSDLPFRHFKEADRYVRWTDVSSSIPINKMLIGYNQHKNHYGIEMPQQDILYITSSAISMSGDLVVDGDITGSGLTVNSITGNTLTVDDITINGSTISDAGAFTLDVGGDITLDAAGDLHLI